MFNFDDIAEKLKKAAVVIMVIEIVLFIILAFLCFFANEFLTGLLMLIIGPIASWLSVLTLYGFGEIIEKLTEISYRIGKQNKVSNSKNTDKWNCPKCNSTNYGGYICKYCGDMRNQKSNYTEKNEWTCPDCGEKNIANAHHCIGCGKERQ